MNLHIKVHELITGIMCFSATCYFHLNKEVLLRELLHLDSLVLFNSCITFPSMVNPLFKFLLFLAYCKVSSFSLLQKIVWRTF